MNDTLKHILKVSAITGIGIGAAVIADMLWPEEPKLSEESEVAPLAGGGDQSGSVIDVTPSN